MFNEALVLKNAPAVFSKSNCEKLSDKYNLLRTADVIEAFEEFGWVTTFASQTGIGTHGRHLIRMRQLEDVVVSKKDLMTELVITNSHDGTSALRMDVGLFRKICSNGLVVAMPQSSETIRHLGKGSTMDAVLERGKWVVEQATESVKTAKRWSKLKLNDKQKDIFANRISKQITLDENTYSASELFAPKYDEPSNLWTCFNMAQERIVRGGVTNQRTGRVNRGTSNVVALVGRNSKLWTIADEMVEVLA